MAQHDYPIMDVEDYLLLERNSKHNRYEYLDGELHMLAGGSNYHGMIAINLATVINSFLQGKGSPCHVYSSYVRLHLSESRYVYPDLSVSCDQRDLELDDMIRYPRLVIEVLSPSTEMIDRVKKAFYYQETATIEEYVLADSLSIRIEVYHREGDGWMQRIYGPGSTVELKSLDLRFPIEHIYRDMKLGGKRSGGESQRS